METLNSKSKNTGKSKPENKKKVTVPADHAMSSVFSICVIM